MRSAITCERNVGEAAFAIDDLYSTAPHASLCQTMGLSCRVLTIIPKSSAKPRQKTNPYKRCVCSSTSTSQRCNPPLRLI